MKVGMIFECGPGGADQKVCEILARKLKPDIQISPATMGSKPALISECGKAAANLLAEGCARVVIIWDLYPSWQRGRSCRKQDCDAIRASLNDANVDLEQVHLVCIERELEAWLLADGRAISAVLSTKIREVSIDDVRNSDRMANPKTRLNQIFQEHSGKKYSDLIHAEQIAKNIENWRRLRRCHSFTRFALKVADVELN